MSISASDRLTVQIAVLATSAADGGAVKNIANIFYFKRDTPLLPMDVANLVTVFQGDVMPDILAALNVDYTLKGYLARCIDDAEEAPIFVADTSVGGTSGERLPDYAAVSVQLITPLRGRNYRGSKHFGPITEADTTGDIIAAGAVSKMAKLAINSKLDLTDTDANHWVPVVFSPSLSQIDANPTTVITAPIVNAITNQLLGTMRRRKTKAA